ncbi:type I-E CRISPR-associated endonuclease Cas1 [Corynebacterium yudongzhengii]|uniref:CRISPR-associated endonuclease Cas1 n=1 Tax=Corynebacterium yudongzhengii TaxID=2080740 RepID=A0A2U1T410_9CORY|nr:type I-E CRISPR-associated endonuclease Cas1e [Corynebacterium yudongzhengii]AWB82412.1 type I-E CRISPR-associated endonuclease Cas1 [Corynebacterium yudongzhengii]PWC00746.1 type I-E CRISPR-associated endonuclease Cas1 [Corynebacterium yudongzhengii]
MAYSEDAVVFAQIPAESQVRFEDRVSFLYLERCTIKQDKTGVVAYSAVDGESYVQRIQIPVSGIVVIQLGPGTSITAAAMTSCTRAGATVMFTGGGGVPAYSHAVPLTNSSRWAIAQARLVASERNQRKAAIKLYKKQLGVELEADETSIAVMRGIEGRMMKGVYREQAKKYSVKNFRRDTKAEDPVNLALNLANSILYGCAASACHAIGVNPALGVIHRGNTRALLFDLADTYKPTVSIPLAFKSSADTDPMAALRRSLRDEIYRRDILKGMLATLMEILEPHLPERDDDRLIAGRGDEVDGHTQYGKK